MRKLVCVLILFLAGCSSNEADTSVIKGLRRDFGKGFYTIEIQTELPEGSPEKYHLSSDLHYKDKKIDEALYAYVSPSGRFAVYESLLHGGIVLFDTKKDEKYRITGGSIPSVEHWSKDEKSFVMLYHAPGNEKRTMRVNIYELEALEE